MAIIKSRLPPTSDVLLTFAAIVFLIHLQAFIGWMVLVPSLIKRYPLWDIIGVVSYVHVFVLAESIMLLFVLVFLAALLPEKYYRTKFPAVSTLFIFLAMPFAFISNIFFKTEFINIRLLIVLLSFGILFGFLYRLVMKYERIGNIFLKISSKLTVLSTFYVVIDFIAIFVLMLRKIGI